MYGVIDVLISQMKSTIHVVVNNISGRLIRGSELKGLICPLNFVSRDL